MVVYKPGNVGHELRKRRKTLGFSMEFIAVQAGISRPTIRKIENDCDKVQMRTIKRYREALDRLEA